MFFDDWKSCNLDDADAKNELGDEYARKFGSKQNLLDTAEHSSSPPKKRSKKPTLGPSEKQQRLQNRAFIIRALSEANSQCQERIPYAYLLSPPAIKVENNEYVQGGKLAVIPPLENMPVHTILVVFNVLHSMHGVQVVWHVRVLQYHATFFCGEMPLLYAHLFYFN